MKGDVGWGWVGAYGVATWGCAVSSNRGATLAPGPRRVERDQEVEWLWCFATSA